jgi:hypothetical protein
MKVTHANHTRLLGRYKTPRFDYGDAAECEVRGEVVITGLSNAPLPWPVGKRPGSRGRGLVVYAGLAEAVRRESVAAVCHWWGVTAQTVWKWRKAMGVGPMTEGTALLKSASAAASPGIAAALKKAHEKDQDPERRRKIAESKRGKARPEHVIEAMRRGRTGTPQSEEAKKKMSEAHRARGTRPPKAGRPWTDAEERMLGKMPDELVARRTGRPVSAVVSRRHFLRIEKFSVWD